MKRSIVKKYFQIRVFIRVLILFTIIQLGFNSEEESICRRSVRKLSSFWLHCLATHVYCYTLASWGWGILSMHQLLMQCLIAHFLTISS